jgi:hypothetical protein
MGVGLHLNRRLGPITALSSWTASVSRKSIRTERRSSVEYTGTVVCELNAVRHEALAAVRFLAFWTGRPLSLLPQISKGPILFSTACFVLKLNVPATRFT